MSDVKRIRKTTIWSAAAERYDRMGLPATAMGFRNEAWFEQEARDEYDIIAAEALIQHEAAKRAA